MVPSRVFVALSFLAAPALAAAIQASAPAAEARAIDTELVACGTRHSMSSWTDPKRGIGCARDVVVRRLERDRRPQRRPAQGGRGQVPDQRAAHRQRAGADGERLRRPRRDRSGARKTAYVVSGHLDSTRLGRHGHQDRRSRRGRRRLGGDRLDPLRRGPGAEARGVPRHPDLRRRGRRGAGAPGLHGG